MSRRTASVVQWTAAGVIILSLLVVARHLPVREGVQVLEGWIQALGVWGPVAFGLLYVVATVLFVPGLLLTLAGGAIFGLLLGTVTISLASTTGAAAAFLIGRYLAREKVAEMARSNPRFDAIDQAIGEGGWRIVALLRLSPAIPFNVQNYLYGLTPIGFWPCVLTSWVAMLPGTFLYVYVGHLTGMAVAGPRQRTTAEWVALGVGLLTTVVVTVYVTRLAQRRLAEQTHIEDRPEEPAAARPAAEPPSPTRTLAVLAIALVAAAGAVYTVLHPQALSRVVLGALGPPPVEIGEAYANRPGGPTFDHSGFDRLLARHVDDAGWVDYAGLATDRPALRRYLDSLAAAPFEVLDRDEKLALLLDAYNGFTLELILEHYPLASIKDIPPVERWKAVRWQVGDHTWSLDQIEQEQIRPKFAEPRIHFALVCAAVGCPPLRKEAYTAERLEEQLEDQARYVTHHERWLRWEPESGVIHLTELFKWYRGDFEQEAGSVLIFVARHHQGIAEALAAGDTPSIRWIPYDWRLNGVENRP